MTRKKHPNKEIEAAILYAEENNWRVENSNGHPFGQMYCPYNSSNNSCHPQKKWCRAGIWSTPGNPYNHARAIRKIVTRCMNHQLERENE